MIKRLIYGLIILCIFISVVPAAIPRDIGSSKPLVFQKSDIQKIEKLISKYGKSIIITSIQSRQGGDCTIQVNNKLRRSLGRPQEVFVTSYSIFFDFSELELTIEEAEELILQTIEEEKQAVAKQIERKQEVQRIAEREKRDYEEFLSGKGKYDKKRIKQSINNSRWKLGVIILIFCLLFFAWARWVSYGDNQILKDGYKELRADELNLNTKNRDDAKSGVKSVQPLLETETHTKHEPQNRTKGNSKKQKIMVQKIIYTGLIIFFGAIIFGIIEGSIGRGQYLFAGLMVYSLFRVWQSRPSKKED